MSSEQAIGLGWQGHPWSGCPLLLLFHPIQAPTSTPGLGADVPWAEPPQHRDMPAEQGRGGGLVLPHPFPTVLEPLGPSLPSVTLNEDGRSLLVLGSLPGCPGNPLTPALDPATHLADEETEAWREPGPCPQPLVPQLRLSSGPLGSQPGYRPGKESFRLPGAAACYLGQSWKGSVSPVPDKRLTRGKQAGRQVAGIEPFQKPPPALTQGLG